MSETDHVSELPKSAQKKKHGRILVEVNQKHIDESREAISSHCMVAEAIKDALPTATFVSVDVQTIRWSLSEKHQRYIALTPRMVQEKIIAFDQGEREGLEPFKFTMRAAQVIPSGQRIQKKPAAAETEQPRAPASPPVAASTSVDMPSADHVPPGVSSLQAREVMIPQKQKRRHRKLAPTEEGTWLLPHTEGGKPPPISVLSRREFGLRALRR